MDKKYDVLIYDLYKNTIILLKLYSYLVIPSLAVEPHHSRLLLIIFLEPFTSECFIPDFITKV